MQYPMSDAWRQAAERHISERRKADERRDAREVACVELYLRQHLEAQGLTVISVRGLSVEVTYPKEMIVPDDWYDQALSYALKKMSAS